MYVYAICYRDDGIRSSRFFLCEPVLGDSLKKEKLRKLNLDIETRRVSTYHFRIVYLSKYVFSVVGRFRFLWRGPIAECAAWTFDSLPFVLPVASNPPFNTAML